ncbi:MAG: hypothetical protein REJ23_01810 [Brevundimonas sp.]|nr:hypothetical protein [Brevundimonas sp.]
MIDTEGFRHWFRQGGDMVVWAVAGCVALIVGITVFGLDQSGFRRSAENAVRAELGQPDLRFKSRTLHNAPRYDKALVCGHVVDAPERAFAVEFNEMRRRGDLYARYQRAKGELPARRLVVPETGARLHPYDAALLSLCETTA